MQIKLVRHGQSLSNTGALRAHEVGDSGIALSPAGVAQAGAAGRTIGREFIATSLVYCSPYMRTRQTTAEILRAVDAAGQTRVYEDPRLREVERGYLDEASQHEARKIHGWFYYRHSGGESPADCYDRTSAFLESLMRQARRRDAAGALIVTHGMTIRCFVTRFLHLTVEQFEMLANPSNCDIITIAPVAGLAAPVFQCGRWGVEGIRLRP
ncbi:histidine phosphatase family protein [Massilia glaciei]|nr:histidine phosphatase family protein [Massilia glaciei]